jgi:Gram-negative bacterial TonB protein C-terminal
MLRPSIFDGWMGLLMGATATAIACISASAQETTPSTPSTAAPVIKLGKMDPYHPLRIGTKYFPKESLNHHEQGRCSIAFLIEVDGTVTATPLLKSTGFPRLDIACFESVIDVPVLPASVDGTPVLRWSDFQLVWVIDRPPAPFNPSREICGPAHRG